MISINKKMMSKKKFFKATLICCAEVGKKATKTAFLRTTYGKILVTGLGIGVAGAGYFWWRRKNLDTLKLKEDLDIVIQNRTCISNIIDYCTENIALVKMFETKFNTWVPDCPTSEDDDYASVLFTKNVIPNEYWYIIKELNKFNRDQQGFDSLYDYLPAYLGTWYDSKLTCKTILDLLGK